MGRTIRHVALMGALVAPVFAGAQDRPAQRGVPGNPMPTGPRAGVTQILNARRALDLTPRQVAQLDSIERVLYAQRRAAGEQMRTMRDSIGAARRAEIERGARRDVTEAQRDSIRGRMAAMRPQMERLRQSDSTARAAAERILTDAQRQQLRLMEAEARGRRQGMQAERRRREVEARRQGPPRGAMRRRP